MELKLLNVNEIKPNPFQPREKFDEVKLRDLANTIKEHGLIEPIVVTQKGNTYSIVAGERRWRAHKLAKKDNVYAIVKNYNSEADIKRDSLIENEMRENLSNEEFKAFTFSLAKSLGKPYYNKGYIDKVALTKHILGKSEYRVRSAFYRRLNRVFIVDKQATTKVKNLLKNEKIDLNTAARIAGIPDKQTQNELADLAKNKSTKEIREEVKKHNFEKRAIEVTRKAHKETDEIKKHNTEVSIVNKFLHKIDSWNYNLELIVKYSKGKNTFFSKFSHENKMVILDNLKPLRRELEKALHLVTKIMEALTK